MDFGTAPDVTQALMRAVREENLGYLAPAVTADLSSAASDWLSTEYAWQVAPERIHSVSDVMAALRIAVEEYSLAESAVIVPTPAYMPFLTYPSAMKRQVMEVPGVVQNGRWQHDLDGIDRAFANGAGTLLLCNPHNPTGTVLRRDELEAIVDIVDRHGGRVFADEIHAPLRFDGNEHVPYASVSVAAAAHTVTGTSASKAWNIPGLKAAQLITSNETDEQRYGRIAFAAVHGASTLGVVASAAAYRSGRGWLAGVLDYLDRNRLLLAERLAAQLPELRFQAPQATYLAWLDLGSLGLPGSPADVIRERGGLALTDGRLCGTGYENHVRLVYAMPRPLLEEAVDALVASALQPI